MEEIGTRPGTGISAPAVTRYPVHNKEGAWPGYQT